eukprot:SAG22_NODE_101_length_20519_cov_15.588002_10_plen_269_part_00
MPCMHGGRGRGPGLKMASSFESMSVSSQAREPPPHVVPRLTPAQMEHFKTEGYVVLPAALDLELCARARDHLWEVLALELPRMRRDDPSTWTTIAEGEATGRSHAGWPDDTQLGAPANSYFSAAGHRLHLHCSEEPLYLDLFPLALRAVAEQVLGAGTVVLPAGPDPADGLVRGPVFIANNGHTHKALAGIKKYEGWVDQTYLTHPPPMASETIAVPPYSPATGAIDGCRGIYCTLPAGQGHFGDKLGENTRADGYPGAHSDVATLTR